MSFFRNKEIRLFTLFIVILATILITASFLISRQAGLLSLISIIILCTAFYIFTYYRYRQIDNLSEYLRKISSGNYSLDVRDNYEGELSILKSEIYKVTQMLSEYNKKLSKDKLILADQMADISHQLKTPLTSMLVMVDLLSDGDLEEEKGKEFISHIQAQLERFEWLLSSLLKMSRLDAGVVKMHMKSEATQVLIEKALSPLLISMELKDIEYIITNPEQINIYCDLNWTAEALTNILKNCIEHTPQGGRIIVTAKDNPLYTQIKIQDNGIGINKDDIAHIFTRYYKGENSSADSVGIGLAMSKTILINQGGDIIVKSNRGKGTMFFVRLYKSVI